MTGGCPSPDRLSWLLHAEDAYAAARDLVQHLDTCADCQRRLEALAGGATLVVRPERGDPVDDARGSVELARGSEPFGVFDGYRTARVIHAGAMAVVLQARDVVADRDVALKTLRTDWAADRRARARMLREARAMTAVRDRHVVPLQALGERDGCPFLVMPWIDGESLGARIRRLGPLPPRQILRLGAELARGLTAVHAAGLVHRDIKPDNVLFARPDDCVQIVDFGLAVRSGARPRFAAVVGTPGYLAPEQAAGMPVDPRADLFGLGATLFAACSGLSPAAGSTTTSDSLPQPCHQRLAVRRLQQELPAALCHCVEQLMHSDPRRRPSASAVVALFTHLQAELA